MASELQIVASRANGALSRGPITPEGKAKSSQNAIRHGLTAKTVVLNNEDPTQFLILCENLTTDYRPETEYERELVSQLASARWKLRRCCIVEKGILDKAIDEMRPAIQEEYEVADEEMITVLALEKAADSPQLKAVRRYMGQILREERHASSQLERIRRERPVQAPVPEPPASENPATAPSRQPENGPARNEPPAHAAHRPESAPETCSSRTEPAPAAENDRPKAS